MKRFIALLAATLVLIFPASAEQPKRPIADAIRELLARHVEWHAYDVSENFVTLVPLGNGVTIKPSEGLPRKISGNHDIFVYSMTGNSDDSLRGELRYLKKDGKGDVLSAFKSLVTAQDGVIDSSENFVTGDRENGIYFLVYILQNGDIIYEKIHNLYADVAVSYRIVTKNNSSNETTARNMVANYFIYRRCKKDNPKDVRCVRPDDPI